jgi:hypothetical protein
MVKVLSGQNWENKKIFKHKTENFRKEKITMTYAEILKKRIGSECCTEKLDVFCLITFGAHKSTNNDIIESVADEHVILKSICESACNNDPPISKIGIQN